MVSKCVSSLSQINMEENYKTISLSELVELGDNALGLKLLVQCLEATYYGVLNHLLKDNQRMGMWLEKVSVPMSDNRRLVGLKKLYAPNILSICIIGMDSKVKKRIFEEMYPENKYSKPLIMKTLLPTEGVEVDLLDENGNEHLDLKFAEILNVIKNEAPRYRNNSRPTLLKVIQCTGDEFFEALNDIEKENVISICGRGMKLNRGGKLIWLCVATRHIIYQFDVIKISPDACFSGKWKNIFSNVDQVKIVDDSRNLQDYLFHKHGVAMCNVFDIQASDIYLNICNNKQQVPHLLKDLPTLLHEYLGYSSKSLAKLFQPIENESSWLERPLPNILENSLAFSVMFLAELRQLMLDLMLVDLEQLTKIFVNSISSKSFIETHLFEEKVVPIEVQQLKQSHVKEAKIKYYKKQPKLGSKGTHMI